MVQYYIVSTVDYFTNIVFWTKFKRKMQFKCINCMYNSYELNMQVSLCVELMCVACRWVRLFTLGWWLYTVHCTVHCTEAFTGLPGLWAGVSGCTLGLVCTRQGRGWAEQHRAEQCWAGLGVSLHFWPLVGWSLVLLCHTTHSCKF